LSAAGLGYLYDFGRSDLCVIQFGQRTGVEKIGWQN